MTRAQTRPPRRHFHPLLIGVGVLLLVLLVARIAATPALEWYVNRKLDESPQYAGQVGNIDLQLLRGAYVIEDVTITKTEADIPVPLFAATRIELSTLWPALRNGTPVGQAELFDPQINLVDSEDETRKQTGAGGKWLDMIDALFPLKIDRVIVHNGQLHFRNYDSDPKIDIALSNMNTTAHNLAGRRAMTDSAVAGLELEALAMDVSKLTLNAAYDPGTEKPSFDVDATLLELPILKLDNFISSYAPFDVEAGTLDVEAVLVARDGVLEGYVKPTIRDLEIFEWSEDIAKDKDNPLVALWEGFVGFIADMKAQSGNELVSTITVKGDIGNTESNVFVATAGVIKDGFAEAYKVNLANTVSLLVPTDEDESEPVPLPAPLEQDTMPAAQ